MITILLVDDTTSDRESCRDALRHAGYRVLEAVDGREAIRTTRVESPDLVIMDLSMPGMDGIQALEKMIDFHVRPAIIIHSSYDTCRRNYIFWGANAYVQKRPGNYDELISRIEQVLERRDIYKAEAVA